MAFTLKYNRTTNHIAGLEVRTQTTGEAKDGVVGYFAENTCGSLTRSRLATGTSNTDLAELLRVARIPGSRKLCKTCEKAATAALNA